MNFPDTYLHAFGLRAGQISRIAPILDSYDSSAWTFPRTAEVGKGRGSCKNKEERIQYFWEYIFRLPVYINHGQIALEGFP